VIFSVDAAPADALIVDLEDFTPPARRAETRAAPVH
jgi:hypothetical protein